MSKKVLFVLVLLTSLVVAQSSWAGYVATYTDITSSSQRTWTDVSVMSDGRVIVSNILSGRGKLMGVNFNPATGVYVSMDTSWTFDVGIAPQGIVYKGQTGGIDSFYVTRPYNVPGAGYAVESVVGSTLGSSVYNHSSSILGIDLIIANDPTEFIFATQNSISRYSLSTNLLSNIISTGSTYFTGVTYLGDINGDGTGDYAVSATANSGAGASSLYTLISVAGGGFDFTAMTGTALSQQTWTGLTNLGDTDNDGMLEFVATANWRTSGSNPIRFIQSTVPVPEPASMLLVLCGSIVSLYRRKK